MIYAITIFQLESLNFSERKSPSSPPPPLEPPPNQEKPPPPPPNDATSNNGNGDKDEDDGDSNRVKILEGRLEFVRVEHQRMLKDLHDQVEGLKRKNKGLLHYM